MNWGRLAGLGALGAGTLLYGALFETRRLTGERRTLRLKGWPESLDGYRIGLMADMHFRGLEEEFLLAHAAIEWLREEGVDMTVLAGDFLSWWAPGSEEMVEHGLQELKSFGGKVLAVPGNHDYYGGDASGLRGVLEGLGIRYLQNEHWKEDGIHWIGVDSGNEGKADPYGPILDVEDGDPIVGIWHEPDMVDWMPKGVDLMLSGHSHGGQFAAPGGWAPMRSRNGARYLRGYYPDAPVPLYVSRGVATTGPGARLFCRPEVTVLTINSV